MNDVSIKLFKEKKAGGCIWKYRGRGADHTQKPRESLFLPPLTSLGPTMEENAWNIWSHHKSRLLIVVLQLKQFIAKAWYALSFSLLCKDAWAQIPTAMTDLHMFQSWEQHTQGLQSLVQTINSSHYLTHIQRFNTEKYSCTSSCWKTEGWGSTLSLQEWPPENGTRADLPGNSHGFTTTTQE